MIISILSKYLENLSPLSLSIHLIIGLIIYLSSGLGLLALLLWLF